MWRTAAMRWAVQGVQPRGTAGVSQLVASLRGQLIVAADTTGLGKTLVTAACALLFGFLCSGVLLASNKELGVAPKYYQIIDGAVDPKTYNGYRRYHASCNHCHVPALQDHR